jgi:hypothetical protein
MRRFSIITLFVLLSVITTICAVKAEDDLQVIESNIPKFQVGDRLGKDRVPDSASLPLGGMVRFWNPNSKKTVVIERMEPDVEEGGTRDLLQETSPPPVK